MKAPIVCSGFGIFFEHLGKCVGLAISDGQIMWAGNAHAVSTENAFMDEADAGISMRFNGLPGVQYKTYIH